MIWNEKFECMSQEEIKNIQAERLKEIVAYVEKNSSFYRERLAAAGISSKDIKSIEDMSLKSKVASGVFLSSGGT